MVMLKQPTYYKFKVQKIEGDLDERTPHYFFNYKELKEYVDVPRTTLFRILKGHKSKYLKTHTFEKVKLPRLELKLIEYA